MPKYIICFKVALGNAMHHEDLQHFRAASRHMLTHLVSTRIKLTLGNVASKLPFEIWMLYPSDN